MTIAGHSPLDATLTELDGRVIEQSPAALWVCRAPHGEIVHYNQLAARLWGRRPEQSERLTGAWRTRFADGRLMSADQSAMAAVLRGDSPVQGQQMVIDRHDGSSVTVSTYVSPLSDRNGRLVGAISAFEDVSDRASARAENPSSRPAPPNAEEHRRESDSEIRRVFDSVLIGVWDYNLHTRHAVRSITHDQIYGYPNGVPEWTFDTFLDHVVPEFRDLIRARFENCASSGEGTFDCRITRADGTPAWIWSRGRVVRDAAGSPARVVGLVMDISWHHRAELASAHESRRKDTFVATLAHELRQPLSVMLAAVEVVRLAPGTESSRRATDVMRRQISQMSRVVEDVVDATRWVRGKATLLKRRLDLRGVISDAAADAAAAVAQHGLDLIVAKTSQPIWVDADPQRLQQVLSNLLRNAVKYTEPGGRISLTAERTASVVKLRVGDTGRGIETEALPHIFDLFSQVRPSEGTGLGIGLSVVRQIVALHGGTIEARSEGLGRGSQFIVTLPLAELDAAEARLSRPSPLKASPTARLG
jgi:PAS domain S-box-containing protein